jgi:hypothetical protein
MIIFLSQIKVIYLIKSKKMKKINPSTIMKWMVAKKTKNIKAKSSINVMVDRSVLSKFLIDCLEGREPLGDGSMICIGEANDIWQQMPKKLIAKYNVIDVDKDGWMICEPRPDNSVNCVEITREFIDDYSGFYIIGQWGEETPEGLIQKGVMGDFICQSRTDSTDVWIVARKIFTNTYNIISE